MLKIEQLHLLVTLSKTGSIHKAADNLFISQPALSKSLKNLEHDLGVILFERTSKGLIPTEICKKILVLAEKTIKNVDDIYFAANSYRWEVVASSYHEEIYLHTEEFFLDYYLADFFMTIQAMNTSFQIQLIKEENIGAISDNSDSHYFILLEEKNQPIIIPANFCKYKIVDVDYAIKTGDSCNLYDRTIINERELFLYPYAHLYSNTKFFCEFYEYLLTMDSFTTAFASDSPMKILNYISNCPAWTLGILFDQKIPKKEFFASASRTKTIKLQTKCNRKYQITLVAHQNAPEGIINLLLNMTRDELIISN